MKKITFLTDESPVIIAEIGGNHGGDLELAKKMVDAAAGAGTNFVKFQTYVTEQLVSPNEPAYAELEREAFSFEQFLELGEHCQQKRVGFLSTPYDKDSADFLDELDVPAFKIASGDITHLSFLRYIAKKGKPILLSTGASNWEEIDASVQVICGISDVEVILLHCISSYPAPDIEANLCVIPEIETRYHSPVGFSDHTVGIDIALGAVALGAQVIEKHFTIDRALPGGDNEISILPDELACLIKGCRRIWSARGNSQRRITASEVSMRPLARRSLVAKRELSPGDVIAEDDVIAVRPGTGIPPGKLNEVVGRMVLLPIQAFRPLQWSDLKNS